MAPASSLDVDETDGPGVYGFYQRFVQGEFTIVPKDNWWLEMWDCTVLLGLMTTAIVLPFKVALLTAHVQALTWLDHAIDALFATDILLTFNIAYLPVETGEEEYERAPFKIWQRYLAFPLSENFAAGWFWLDLITVLPPILPWERLFPGMSEMHIASLRLVRVARMLRMLRLVRIFRLFRKYHTEHGFPITRSQIAKCTCFTLLACHWLACAFGAMALSMDGKVPETWFNNWQQRFGHRRPIHDCSVWEVYNLALYFALSTLTTVGFGDLCPQTQDEMVLTSFAVIALGVTWGYGLATVVTCCVGDDVTDSNINFVMDDLNALMDYRNLSTTLKRRCRRHLYQAMKVHRARHQMSTMQWLSESLRGEIAIASGVDKICDRIWYLKDIKYEVLLDLAYHFQQEMFSPYEFIMDRFCVSVIEHGTCAMRGKLLTRHDVIGEDIILMSEELRSSACPRTLSFVELVMLSRKDLVTVCEKHRDFNRRMRRAQIKLAVWRGFIQVSDIRKRKRQRASGRRFVGRLMGRGLQFASSGGSTSSICRGPGFVESFRTVRRWTGDTELPRVQAIIEDLGRRFNEEINQVAHGFHDVMLTLNRSERALSRAESDDELARSQRRRISGRGLCGGRPPASP